MFYDIPFPTCLLPMHRNCMAWIAHQGSPPRSSLFQAEEAGRLKDNVIERQPIVRIRICKYSLSTSRSAQRSQQHQHAAAQVANQPSAQNMYTGSWPRPRTSAFNGERSRGVLPSYSVSPLLLSSGSGD